MVWQHLSVVDYLVLAIFGLAALSIIPLRRRDLRRRRQRAAEWNEAYYRRGGLIRALIARWHRGPARLTDQRQPPDPIE